MRSFDSLDAFASFLAHEAADVVIRETVLEQIGSMVKERAQSKLGTFQPAVGDFAEWVNPLAEYTQQERVKLGYTPNDPLLASRELYESIDFVIDPSLDFVTIGTPLDKGLWNEVGTSTSPPRPFLGPAAFELKEEIVNLAGAVYFYGIVNGDRVRRGGASLLGNWGRAVRFDV